MKTSSTPEEGDRNAIYIRGINLPWLKVFLWVALTATVFGALFATKTLSNINKNIAAAKEAARPANVKLTKITAPGCSDCYNLDDAISFLKKQSVSIGDEQAVTFDSSQGQELIKKLSIKRVPTFVLTGEVNKSIISGFVKANGSITNNTFVYNNVPPIFVDPSTKQEVGKVTVTYLTDPSCPKCADPKLTVNQYKKVGIHITQENEVSWDSSDGQQLINQYKITKLPTFLFSPDIDYYSQIRANWAGIGTIEQDKTYVARTLFPPYRDLSKGQVVGLVDTIYLTDSTCPDCYKPDVSQKQILTQGYGVAINSEQTVDINSAYGQSLKTKYSITQIPTILLSPDAGQYSSLKTVWTSVGTVETDGWYVFRQMKQLGGVVYKDLTNNQIIRPAQPSPQPSPTQ